LDKTSQQILCGNYFAATNQGVFVFSVFFVHKWVVRYVPPYPTKGVYGWKKGPFFQSALPLGGVGLQGGAIHCAEGLQAGSYFSILFYFIHTMPK